jgi:hypothetical protein
MRSLLFLPLLLLAACATRGPDVQRLGAQSFSYAEPMAIEAAAFPDEVVGQFRASVSAALAARGLQHVPEGGDLVVDVIAHVESITTSVGIVNPDLTPIRRTSQPVLFTSRHIDGMEVRELRVDEGTMKVMVRPVGESRALYTGRSTQRMRHIDLDNSAQVIQAAVHDAFSEWPVGR